MPEGLRIAVASGKGGTGKTTVAVNLLAAAIAADRSVAYLDCDVEEPNGAIFLAPEIREQRPVFASVPVVDDDRCNRCGLCGKICRFSAIVPLETGVLTFPELCHDCGGCLRVCPTGAVAERKTEIGRLRIGSVGPAGFAEGVLSIGQAMSPPVIRAVQAAAPPAEITLWDAPPGTSCPAVQVLADADVGLLVTEPTPFGLHDLQLAVATARRIELPVAVVINRAVGEMAPTRGFCRQAGLEILAEIPDRRDAAEACSRGQLLYGNVQGFAQRFEALLARTLQWARDAGAVRT
jgi:MinD superfamily P-loop ATPase